jgi:CheY-like chemotaxis protein
MHPGSERPGQGGPRHKTNVPPEGTRPAPAEPSPRVSPGSRETILLVEDHPGVRALVGEVLRRAGYVILAARHGREALEMCSLHPGTIDLLVTDLELPHMTGPEVARAVRPLYPGLKVLYISGYTAAQAPPLELSTAGTGFLQKPFPPEGLLQTVRALLGNAE